MIKVLNLYEYKGLIKHFFKGKWVVENVVPYYEPLISAQQVGRHLFWSNFQIIDKKLEGKHPILDDVKVNDTVFGFNLSKYKLKHRKVQILRNLVNPMIGLHIFESAFKKKQEVLKI